MSAETPTADCLELMQRLIQIRYQKALHHQLMKAADHSMLSIDVLVLIYHFAKTDEGSILEIGSFLGASTIAAGLGARDSGKQKKIISIETGGPLKNHRLATRDIFRDLKKNLSRAGLLDAVTLIESDVRDHHIRVAFFDRNTRVPCRIGFGTNEQVVFAIDDPPQPLPNDGMIVDDEHPTCAPLAAVDSSRGRN